MSSTLLLTAWICTGFIYILSGLWAIKKFESSGKRVIGFVLAHALIAAFVYIGVEVGLVFWTPSCILWASIICNIILPDFLYPKSIQQALNTPTVINLDDIDDLDKEKYTELLNEIDSIVRQYRHDDDKFLDDNDRIRCEADCQEKVELFNTTFGKRLSLTDKFELVDLDAEENPSKIDSSSTLFEMMYMYMCMWFLAFLAVGFVVNVVFDVEGMTSQPSTNNNDYTLQRITSSMFNDVIVDMDNFTVTYKYSEDYRVFIFTPDLQYNISACVHRNVLYLTDITPPDRKIEPSPDYRVIISGPSFTETINEGAEKKTPTTSISRNVNIVTITVKNANISSVKEGDKTNDEETESENTVESDKYSPLFY